MTDRTALPVSKIVDFLLLLDPSEESLAHRLNVSVSTIARWRSGVARPRPSVEGELRQMVVEQSKALELREGCDLFAGDFSESNLRNIITGTLREVREILHRTGRLSSRHEALDEVGKLLFAHIMSIGEDHTGISRKLLTANLPPAVCLQNFVRETFHRHLPISLSHELKPQDFELRIRKSENLFAAEIIDCFDRLASQAALSKIRGPRGVDILNDTFGQFLADSFVDEKELGQYLTPTEVVKFMVELGLSSLDKADLDPLCHYRVVRDAGLILDPSCGVGSFLSEAFRILHKKVAAKNDFETVKAWVARVSRSMLVGIDKSERMIKLALTNLAMFGVPTANLHLANALLRSGDDATITRALEGKAKLILTNPPFGATFRINDISSYRIASQWSRNFLRTIDSELLFLERYIDWLAPGGVLVMIVPDSILTNRGVFEDLRKGISGSAEILSVISLPQVTFGVAGTNTKTSVLHLRKSKEKNKKKGKVYCAVCQNIGYEVFTRGSQRKKVPKGTSDLGVILAEAISAMPPKIGAFVDFDEKSTRWDASYHVGSPLLREAKLEERKEALIRVRDVAELVIDRENPERRGSGDFAYIEISDVDAATCDVRVKTIKCSEAPSRARRLVRAGDVLVSTVRPERRTVGVVPKALDGAICSTGFAVLRPKGIQTLLLARLLQSDLANAQILRNNSGIAYPVIDENCLLDVVLPTALGDLDELKELTTALATSKERVSELESALTSRLDNLLERWNQ